MFPVIKLLPTVLKFCHLCLITYREFTLINEAIKYIWSLLRPSASENQFPDVDGRSYKTLKPTTETIQSNHNNDGITQLKPTHLLLKM